jgi:hypothetical protein
MFSTPKSKQTGFQRDLQAFLSEAANMLSQFAFLISTSYLDKNDTKKTLC